MFTKPYTDLDAYWVGFLRADGCIVRSKYCKAKTVKFELADLEPVEAFKAYIGAKNIISKYLQKSTFGEGIIYRFQSAIPAYILDDLGLKTELDPWFYNSKHFWRGLIDGDGSLIWRNFKIYKYPYLKLCGSLVDMNYFSDWVYQIIKERISVGTHGKIFVAATSGGKAAYLTKLLYDGEYSALSRKKQLAISFMDWHSEKAWKMG